MILLELFYYCEEHKRCKTETQRKAVIVQKVDDIEKVRAAFFGPPVSRCKCGARMARALHYYDRTLEVPEGTAPGPNMVIG